MSVRWLFLDMNSFFAAAEQHDQPELRGQPVGVIPTDTEHTCCIAASIEAKRHGIRTGTSVRDARYLCPNITIIKARPDRYVQLHQQLIQRTNLHLPITRIYSIDEWACRLMGQEQQPEQARTIALAIQRELEDFSPALTCSIGIAPTRLLAKIACELHKPNGLSLLPVADLPRRLGHLQLTDLPGISTGVRDRLARYQVHTIEQLHALTLKQARTIWGSVQGEHWLAGFHGQDLPEVKTRRSSMGHAHVLPPAFRSETGAHGIMTRLLHKLGARLRYHGYFAHALHVSVSYARGPAWQDGVDLSSCQDTLTLLQQFQRMWDRRPRTGEEPKKVAVTCTGLTAEAQATPLLFDQAQRDQRLARAMDAINQRMGGHKIYFAGMHDCRHAMDDKIAFGRIPDEAGANM